MRRVVILATIIGTFSISSVQFAAAENAVKTKPQNNIACVTSGRNALDCAVYCTAIFAIWNICF